MMAPKRTVAVSVNEIPGKQLACRALHKWPSADLVDSRGIPRGMRAALVDKARDMWWVLDECPRCGKIRYKRYPHRAYDGTGWHYTQPADWVVYAGRLSSAEAFEENVQRNFAKLFGPDQERS